MLLRIFLFGSAIGGVLVAALVWAVITGQYEAAQPSPSASAVASGEPAASSSPAASVAETASESVSAEASPSVGPSGAVTMVEILNSVFGPDLTVAVGTTVMWMNGDSYPHTTTQGSDGVKASDALFDLKLPGGASASYTFTEAGTYQVTCTLHPNMNMTITVQ
ncbi:MAG: plastocyanin/azurin family copper-binding protein [Chloroflexota bacterium]